MFSIIYLIITSLLLPLWLPLVILLFWYRKLLGVGRFGLCPKSKNKPCVWLHAASVGEVNALSPLVAQFKNSGYSVFASTMTRTGKDHLLKKFPEGVTHFYLPLDWPIFTSIALMRLRPSKIVIVETELWPGLFFSANFFKIPLTIVSARISDKSYKGYVRLKFLLKSVLNCVDSVYAQSEMDKQRFLDLGLSVEKAFVCGNLKNDYLNQLLKAPNEELDIWKSKEYKKIIFGSFRPKEASFVVQSILTLMHENANFRFILCPRHFDWLESLYKEFEAKQILFSVFSKTGLKSDHPVIVIDEMGKLLSAYSGGYAAFVGGTLFEQYGGHNMLEPAAFGLPVFHGPFYSEQKGLAEPLLKNKGSVIVEDSVSFSGHILALQKDEALYTCSRLNAMRTVEQESYSLHMLIENKLFT